MYADRLQYFVAPKLGPDEGHVHQYVIGPISGGVCSVPQLTQASVGLWQQAVNEVALGLPQGLDDCVLEQHNTNMGTQCHTNNPSITVIIRAYNKDSTKCNINITKNCQTITCLINDAYYTQFCL